MLRTPTTSRFAALLAPLVALAACDATPGTSDGAVDTTVVVSVAGVGVPIATVVVEVSGPGITLPLVFNLVIADGVASGRVSIPPGAARTLTARAFDSEGAITHEGSLTLDIAPGENAAVTIAMVPRPGEQPITVHVGPVTVAVTPAAATLAVGVTQQLAATVSTAAGPLPSVQVEWASANPARATVGAAGLVTAVSPGVATIVATYAGTAAVSQITVQ